MKKYSTKAKTKSGMQTPNLVPLSLKSEGLVGLALPVLLPAAHLFLLGWFLSLSVAHLARHLMALAFTAS